MNNSIINRICLFKTIRIVISLSIYWLRELRWIKYYSNKHHHHHHDFFEKLKHEERIENEDKKVSSSSEYRWKFEDARVTA